MRILHWHIAAVEEGTFYVLPEQEEVDASFFKQLEESLSSQTLALLGNFTHIVRTMQQGTCNLDFWSALTAS